MHIVRRHLFVATLLLLALQGTGLVAVAQPGIGSSAGSSCTCECCRNTPGAHCPVCARARAGHCDCSARGNSDAEHAEAVPRCSYAPLTSQGVERR